MADTLLTLVLPILLVFALGTLPYLAGQVPPPRWLRGGAPAPEAKR